MEINAEKEQLTIQTGTEITAESETESKCVQEVFSDQHSELDESEKTSTVHDITEEVIDDLGILEISEDEVTEKSDSNLKTFDVANDNKRNKREYRTNKSNNSNSTEKNFINHEVKPSGIQPDFHSTLANGKKKIKEGKPLSKVVVRRLPPSMAKETFLDQVSPLPPHDYFYYIMPSHCGPYDFSRAYINFTNLDDLYDFTRTFDNYVFIDGKGHEYPAVVEFAPFQRVARERSNRKKDTLVGTLEMDPIFITFNEHLLAEALESSKSANTIKQHYFETEITANESEEMKTTPLLEFLKARRATKMRIREEKKEDRKRKDAEKKLVKQKQKEKQQSDESAENKSGVSIKVLQNNKDKKEKKEKELKKNRSRDKDERFNKSQDSKIKEREFKNKSGKSYKEERLKQAERREEKKKKEFERSTEEECKVMDSKDDVGAGDMVTSSWGKSRVKSGRAFVRKRIDGNLKNKPRGRGLRTTTAEEKRILANGKEAPLSASLPSDTAMLPAEETKTNDSSRLNNDTDDVKPVSSSVPTISSSNQDDEETSHESTVKSKSDTPIDENKRSSKDPRAERRIKNKDRPSIEIYRPGMGKFSRQRLEKQRSTGTVDESPCHSPSPTSTSQA